MAGKKIRKEIAGMRSEGVKNEWENHGINDTLRR